MKFLKLLFFKILNEGFKSTIKKTLVYSYKFWLSSETRFFIFFYCNPFANTLIKKKNIIL